MKNLNLSIPGVKAVLAGLIPDPIPFDTLTAILNTLGVTSEQFLAACEKYAADHGVPTPNLDTIRAAYPEVQS